MQAFFVTRESLCGHTKTSVTVPLLKILKLHAVGALKINYWINVGNFVMKCLVVIGNHYFDIMVEIQCTHCRLRENRQVVMIRHCWCESNLTYKCRWNRCINLRNFWLKFQAVSEKLVKTPRGRILPHSVFLHMGCGDVIISTTVAMTPCCGERKHCHFVRFYITS